MKIDQVMNSFVVCVNLLYSTSNMLCRVYNLSPDADFKKLFHIKIRWKLTKL